MNSAYAIRYCIRVTYKDKDVFGYVCCGVFDNYEIIEGLENADFFLFRKTAQAIVKKLTTENYIYWYDNAINYIPVKNIKFEVLKVNIKYTIDEQEVRHQT